ncbi:MAG: hypothetical protein JWO36_2863 [Myxococcales bacterium]|nr:hypothetical protein [Myxococcales bacterium]
MLSSALVMDDEEPERSARSHEPRPQTDLDGATTLGHPGSSSIPKRLTPADVAPELRQELKLTRKASGGFDVHDPSAGRTFTLNDFEVSLARMLNGRRQISEILDAGGRLGIPVNLESLEKFIQQLEEYGFLRTSQAAASIPAPETKTWASRGQWESSVRSLFQSGIRFLRMGKHVEAAGYFEALLQEDPDNIEARELLAMAQQASTVQAPPQSPPPQQLAPAWTPPPQQPQAWAPQAPIAPAWQQQPQMQQWPPPVAPAWLPPAHVASPPVASRAQRFRRPAQIGAAALVVIVIGAFVLSRGSSSTAQPETGSGHPLVVAAKPEPTKPEPTKPEPIKPEPIKPEPIKPDPIKPDPIKPDPTTADPATPEPTKPEPTKPEPAKPEPAQATAATSRIEAPGAGQVTSFLRATRKVRKGDKLFQIVRVTSDAAKTKELTAKVADLEKLAKQDAMYEPFLASARTELASVRKVVTTIVKAPRAGSAEPRVKQGAVVHAGQLLAEIQ